ncbi:hypothetical protein [Curtobacterium sp. P97]|uniref:hypothetical protein n=1 Tax=Curtobacterium sp. P97 TaxID=2939562 RepID=UPI00203DDAC1|nr:hypothetical protein [Curtobacterium sp. P97]MCM3521761.1 hypothetical protein [Curtobacterium sp. P97]
MTVTLPPDQYEGQQLCPRCGDDGTGHRYQICAEEQPLGFRPTHAESCERYRYANELCSACESLYEQETP